MVYPNVWGPHQWNMLHMMALVYPEKPDEERKQSMLAYLSGMCKNLPCPGCSAHCGLYLNENRPQVDSKQQLFQYLVDFHNSVNKRLGKREFSQEEALTLYQTKAFDHNTLLELSRADQSRREDHKTIHQLTNKVQLQHIYYPLILLVVVVIAITVIILWARKIARNSPSSQEVSHSSQDVSHDHSTG